MSDAVTEPVSIPPFVDATSLERIDGEVVLADVRWSLDGSEGYDTYLERHLPGAVYIDLDSVLAASPTAAEGRHPLPSPETFARGLGAAGLSEDEVVIAYDQGPGAIAARLVWMLRVIGQPAAVLDGGLAAWKGAVESGETTRPAVRRRVRPWPQERFADADLTATLARSSDAVVLDARDPARYRGDLEPIDARPGHVPGAVNQPFADNVDPEGRLRPVDELSDRYGRLGAIHADEVVAYCGSGVTACHDLLVLEHLGAEAGRLYPGSWSAWSADPTRQAATGPQPG
jgi:thiosulfate/3-mercaptopyruvate sulfurtransferase